MNKHLNGGEGNEMKRGKTKIWSLIGLLLFCVSTQVAAGVCESEIQQVKEIYQKHNMPAFDINEEMKDVYNRVTSGYDFKSYCGGTTGLSCEFSKGVQPTSPDYGAALIYQAKILEFRAQQETLKDQIPGFMLKACLARHMAATRNTTPGKPVSSTNRRSPPNSASANSSANPTPEAQRLNTELRAAEVRAQNNQTKVDRARKGKPKRHVEGSIAHQCLTPQTGGGVVNACPFAVEYSYCVLRPTKGSWSAAFDCEKSKGGTWQIGPGPNNRSIMHTDGLTTYFFACRYGETLHKPDGISPADIEFQLGRGLLGRCAEWGARK